MLRAHPHLPTRRSKDSPPKSAVRAHWHHNVTNYGFFNVIGYISDNLLIPILDFFYGLVPS
ncbi:MAG: hypothetical protein VX069_03305, partial [Cyanobacteriota bacterium]|nr:hypothetical protein [Cyanobacteriota bacterium]